MSEKRAWLIEKRKTINKKGLTQEELAKKVGMSRSTYASIEIGRRNPSVELAKKIAKVLKISWKNFFQ